MSEIYLLGCGEMIEAVYFLFENTHILNTVYRQVVRVPMDTNCAPLIADWFLHCYKSQFMTKRNKTRGSCIY